MVHECKRVGPLDQFDENGIKVEQVEHPAVVPIRVERVPRCRHPDLLAAVGSPEQSFANVAHRGGIERVFDNGVAVFVELRERRVYCRRRNHPPSPNAHRVCFTAYSSAETAPRPRRVATGIATIPA